MPHVRKARAGSDSHGNLWAKDGAVVEVPGEVAAALLAIPDGGFSLVTEPEPEPVEEPAPEPENPVDEPAPEPENPVGEAPKPRQPRSGRKPRASSAGSSVEE